MLCMLSTVPERVGIESHTSANIILLRGSTRIESSLGLLSPSEPCPSGVESIFSLLLAKESQDVQGILGIQGDRGIQHLQGIQGIQGLQGMKALGS